MPLMDLDLINLSVNKLDLFLDVFPTVTVFGQLSTASHVKNTRLASFPENHIRLAIATLCVYFQSDSETDDS